MLKKVISAILNAGCMMNKTDLIKYVSQECAIPIKTTQKMLDSTLNQITEALLRGEIVSLAHFGKFFAKYSKKKKKTVPSTALRVSVPPKFVPKFSAFRALKRRFLINFG